MDRGELFAALDGLPWPSFVMSLDQVVVYWSDGLLDLLGYSSFAALGRPCWQMGSGMSSAGLTPDCREGCAIYRVARAGMVPSSVELEMRTAWGERRRVRVVPVALGHVGWIDRLLIYVLVSAREQAEDAGAGPLAWFGRAVLPEEVRLTDREREVMLMVARGWRNAFIAEELGVALNTVRTHVANVRVKLGVSSRMEAALIALRMGLIDPR